MKPTKPKRRTRNVEWCIVRTVRTKKLALWGARYWSEMGFKAWAERLPVRKGRKA